MSDKLTQRAETLRSAGFNVVYTHRPDEDQDWIPWHGQFTYPATGTELYADLSRVASGPDAYGQVSTIDRSNFRSLIRDYPDTFTVTSYSNGDALGAFVADLTDDLVSILVKLRTDYPLYDEDDLSELESDEVTESWEQYVSADIRSEIQSDAWDMLSADDQRDLFWQVVTDLDICPEHDGRDIRWSVHYPAIAAEIDRRLRTEV